jgi:hypothetical protein
VKDIVLITTYFRPEYLSLCLEYLSKAEGAQDDKEYWVLQDFRFEDEHRHGLDLRWTKEVIERSPLPIRYIERKPHGFVGNSYNTLEAYKEAYDSDARFIYLVEDDVLATTDFFRWHEAVQAKEDSAMCSVAYRCSRNGHARKDITDPAAYFISSSDFASIGCCWRRENLKEVVKHACPEYYNNMQPYLDDRFPDDVYKQWFGEQDGLVMRVLHQQKSHVVWPYVPRAWHIGNVGYHRPGGRRADGQLQNKIDILKSWIHNAEMLKIVAPDFGDIEPVPMEATASWDANDLKCIQEIA